MYLFDKHKQQPTVTPILQRKTDPDSAANILMIWAEYLLQETVFKCVLAKTSSIIISDE